MLVDVCSLIRELFKVKFELSPKSNKCVDRKHFSTEEGNYGMKSHSM